MSLKWTVLGWPVLGLLAMQTSKDHVVVLIRAMVNFKKKVLNSACLIIKALFQATSFFPPQLEKDTLELFLKRKLQYSIEMWSSPSKYSCVYL